MTAKIIHVRKDCIGCGACAAISPEFWTMDDDGKSDLVGSVKVEPKKGKESDETREISEEEVEINRECGESCPVNVIHVFDKSGKKLI